MSAQFLVDGIELRLALGFDCDRYRLVFAMATGPRAHRPLGQDTHVAAYDRDHHGVQIRLSQPHRFDRKLAWKL